MSGRLIGDSTTRSVRSVARLGSLSCGDDARAKLSDFFFLPSSTGVLAAWLGSVVAATAAAAPAARISRMRMGFPPVGVSRSDDFGARLRTPAGRTDDERQPGGAARPVRRPAIGSRAISFPAEESP